MAEQWIQTRGHLYVRLNALEVYQFLQLGPHLASEWRTIPLGTTVVEEFLNVFQDYFQTWVSLKTEEVELTADEQIVELKVLGCIETQINPDELSSTLKEDLITCWQEISDALNRERTCQEEVFTYFHDAFLLNQVA